MKNFNPLKSHTALDGTRDATQIVQLAIVVVALVALVLLVMLLPENVPAVVPSARGLGG
jgi:hypothetical protein